MPRPSRRQTFGLGVGAGLAAGIHDARAASTAPEPTFTLLLVNDLYRMSETEGRGGFARLNAIVKAERARGVPLLYAHAGDTLSPSLMSGFDQGAHIVELLNIAPPDVFVPGNHEFDFGPAIVARRMGEANFPVFAANLRDGAGRPLRGVRDRTVVTLGGIRVGIVGIALASTPDKSQSGDLRFAPELETLAREAQTLRAEGADLVVGVCHTGRATDEAIVAGRLVDILLSGHDHDLALRYDGQTVMVESSFDAHFVTAIDVTVQVTGSGKARTVTWRPSFRVHDSARVVPDPETLAVVRRLEGDLSRELDVAVGETRLPLDSRIAAVRAREASFGNLVADAVRASTGADLAIVNGGGIRGDTLYPAGRVLTRRDILLELPFGNTTVLVALTGAQIRGLLETGVSEFGRPAGRFPQVSGLVVTVDPTAPVGARIVALSHGGVPLDPDRTYTVGSNNFLYDGGNGYGALSKGRTLVGGTDGTLVANAVMAYIRTNAPLSVPSEGRILTR
ncbi:multifunctional 2',3'-cyclic-nucleotide 2'-phosphodiesterase/5'-nucleotidase/3'-nucleotidase [Methylobacterium sp. Leaf469]|uniref:bifunctional metallophosphatase/5'-nucleotidase n=1 Tax=Methylobacterium sp. Leaf469 TaxID=1736387 RepID=UPI0006F3D898|nr:bifunctional UDP-sugar hydrolase/5'-nucleotidase [Methylobacterium sp. Leaf469]KQT90075.1 multifunctional 2',3'-cyclic-nucleotide 2'-phosphodiesterase/5'-nucleotidase/3'-nucleotidase [Methylobacterium sp. Leaf469]